LAIFRNSLADAAVIDIGQRKAHEHLFTRIVHLVKDPKTRILRPLRSVATDWGAATSPAAARQSAARARH